MGEKVITGNYFDKYNTKNPIYRNLMTRFFSSFLSLINANAGNEKLNVLEIGCGEGELTKILQNHIKQELNYKGFDIDNEIVNEAKANNSSGDFKVGSVYDLSDYLNEEYDFVIASEVLEHLEFPEKAFQEILKIESKYFLFSVPREPIWRMLNVIRFKYLSSLGNTPGHIQHWSKNSFSNMIKNYFQMIKIESPWPWTIVLCEKAPKK
jgi:2-polyprenyl-3-methyl-5-hydroxy-6-metoxy-1,4-benzoquinol methylase